MVRTNLEAADEVVRQLRLRDIGGIIVIDFIDMEDAFHRAEVFAQLNEALERDRTKTRVTEISRLGLVEMTRKNVTDGLYGVLTEPCPTCRGQGTGARPRPRAGSSSSAACARSCAPAGAPRTCSACNPETYASVNAAGAATWWRHCAQRPRSRWRWSRTRTAGPPRCAC